ncbi:MAG: hypothetical protein RI947_261 [Candidatus Parcubacteria bacterium]|jgi:hypothetical protein
MSPSLENEKKRDEAQAEELKKVQRQTEEEIDQTQQEAQLRQLGEQLKSNFLGAVKGAAERALQFLAVKKDPTKPQPTQEQQKEAHEDLKLAAQGVMKFLTGVVKGVIATPSDKEKSILTELSTKIDGYTSSVYLQPLIQRMIDNPTYVSFSAAGSEPTQFEKDFTSLKSQDAYTASRYKEAILRAVQQGKLAGITEADAHAKFNADPAVKNETEATLPSKNTMLNKKDSQEHDSLLDVIETAIVNDPNGSEVLEQFELAFSNDNYTEYRRALNRLAVPLILPEAQLTTFFNLHKRALAFGAEGKSSFTNAERDALRSLANEIRTVKTGLSTKEIIDLEKAVDTRNKDVLRQMLGWDTQKIDKYIELESRTVYMLNPSLQKQALEMHGISVNDLKYLSSEYILARFDDFFKKGPDGNLHLSDEGRQLMVKGMYEVTTKWLSRANSTSLSKFEELFDPTYATRVKTTIVQSMYELTRMNALTDRLNDLGIKEEFTTFSNRLILEFNDETSLRKHYHELKVRMLTTQMEPKDVKSEGMKLTASQREAMLNSYHPELLQMAIAIFERDLQNKIATSGNMLPTDLFASYFTENERLHTPDLIRVRQKLWEKIKGIQTDPEMRKKIDNPTIREIMEVQEWEIDRAVGLAVGFSMGDSARMEEILGMATKRPGNDFTGQIHIASFFNIMHKWRLGRGRDAETATGLKTPEIFELAIDMEAQSKSFIDQLKNRWIPKDVYDKADVGARRGIDEIFEDLDETLKKKIKVGSKKEVSFHEAMKTFNRLGIFSVAGWRFTGFTEWIKGEISTAKASPDFTEAEKQKWTDADNGFDNNAFKYDYLRKNIGVGACWIADGGRAEDDARELVFQQVSVPGFTKIAGKSYYDSAKETLGEKEAARIYTNYKKRDSTDSERRILKVEGHKMTVEEFIDEKKRAYRGMNFQGLLERSPYDFMINMMQLEPDLSKTIKLTKASAEPQTLTAYEYYFTDGAFISDLTDAEKKERQRIKKHFLRRWAENEEDVKGPKVDDAFKGDANIKQLGKVALVWHKVYQEYAKRDEEGKIISYNEGKAKEKMEEIMTLAAEKVKLTNKYSMTKEDIVQKMSDEEKEARRVQIKEEAGGDEEKAKREISAFEKMQNDKEHESEFFNSLFLGNEGLIAQLAIINEKQQKLDDKFGDLDGKPGALGAKKFFHALAYRWYEVDERDILPNTNEMKQIPMFKHMAKAGEETFTRLWGDIEKINGVLDKLMNLDNILLGIASTGKLDPVYKLHEEIQGLEGTITIEGAQKWNYILATVVARFFQEDYKGRFPWPLSIVMTPMSRSISLSTLHNGYNSLTWKEEEIRLYAHHLWKEGYLGEKGKWSKEMLEKQLGASNLKYGLLQVVPSLLSVIAFSGVVKMVSTAFSEEWNGKK